MESGKVREVSQAVRQVGISRSTYYKYKDTTRRAFSVRCCA